MGVKVFMVCFILSSLLFMLLYIPTRLTMPISTSMPAIKSSFNISRISKESSSYPVTFSYLISASKGDSSKLKRLLRALYHPGNYYLIHMDYGAPKAEHKDVIEFVAKDPVFGAVGNVWVVGKPNLVTYRGPTMLSTTLHAMAILLRTCQWDWFINLSASDYPLVTQDDLIQAFSGLPRDVNFIHHSSHLGWKFNKRGKPMIIDPGLYSLKKSEIWWVSKQRSLPKAFKLYTGSAWIMLSRSFAEYCIVGWENLPRTLLLYYTNFVSSPEGYFQTVICNSKDYKNTVANNDLHYITWDNPPKQHPRSLGLTDYRKMVLSNRPFARKFKKNDPVLDKIDRELLKRHRGQFSFGGWCSQGGKNRTCSALRTDNFGVLSPGLASRRLTKLLAKTVSGRNFHRQQCRSVLYYSREIKGGAVADGLFKYLNNSYCCPSDQKQSLDKNLSTKSQVTCLESTKHALFDTIPRLDYHQNFFFGTAVSSLFSSQDSLADPSYFQRARREKMTRSLPQACADESSDELMLSMRTHDESECLSDIDDLEVDRYLLNEEERGYKKIIWEKLNWEYLKDQAAKEAAAKQGFDGLLVTRELDTSASASVAKSQKGKKKRQTQVANGSGSVQLNPKATQALSKKRLSSKVNFEMVEKLFGQPDTQAALEIPKKARFEPCSEDHDNLESEPENKNRGDDELESIGGFEETNDMGELYENTCYDNNVDDEGYNYDDDDYNFE